MKIEKIISNKGNLLSGPFLIKPDLIIDKRGIFFESWNKRLFDDAINQRVDFVQENESISFIGILRGLHFQLNPTAQGKLIRATNGEIFDVMVDLRKNSSTFLDWFGTVLNEENNFQLWVPPGFAHGFLTLSEKARVCYKVTNYWSRKDERSLIWNENKIGIKWPLNKINETIPKLSKKDMDAKNIDYLIRNGEVF
ncbi:MULTISPECIES: dTDP-4-dehydrorhamnose 3,5-epimerase [Prochlorococcus]|uniref:dTDP-4-dehydrorhamnose 3,5-epimerase n=1 Tax=Prochlorococcus marinus str. MIT 9116 TaxID=167544 RepID=A0A0A1ZU07_PROMR|nr:dTDP-4-dehydrorhamnose 3,5-epimerase [Prochlorococcus marinus]KGF91950.1 dTDP-4-dehydrorhamnose 3,5-epimerase [Prochlorococcus marinus str. MIT 9107]KGF93037.1 dTDP-4-dehydrorhamnose 3,5-epimerase [Prochlorococcus marinus str. MIT 9116]KGF94005.1 dTDP-4-dehydrorhamnose 3,5-epimerase [Prochlorococcus marinus str. MIT 9123]